MYSTHTLTMNIRCAVKCVAEYIDWNWHHFSFSILPCISFKLAYICCEKWKSDHDDHFYFALRDRMHQYILRPQVSRPKLYICTTVENSNNNHANKHAERQAKTRLKHTKPFILHNYMQLIAHSPCWRAVHSPHYRCNSIKPNRSRSNNNLNIDSTNQWNHIVHECTSTCIQFSNS